MRFLSFLVVPALFVFSGLSYAGEADVTKVSVNSAGDGQWRFDVSVRHADTGWEHYADRWEVVGLDGNVLGTRVLAHPHVDEQPFTRSGVIAIPKGISSVSVRAHDLVHGYGGAVITVTLP